MRLASSFPPIVIIFTMSITTTTIILAAGIKCDLRYVRKIFAPHLRQSVVQPEVVDMLQVRVAQYVLARHYLVPRQNFKEDVLQALEKLMRLL